MKAVIYKNKTFSYVEIDQPNPQTNEVLIKVISTALNAGDYRLVQLNSGLPKSGILGNAIAGIVEKVGADVVNVRVGEAVVVDTSNANFGGLSEYAIAQASSVVNIPKSVSFVEASACPVASTTALDALTLFKTVKDTDKLLIIGASGGVGTFTVQLAKHFKTHVTAVCSTYNVDRMRELKADHVINYQTDDLHQLNETYDFIITINGSYPLSLYKRLLKPNGVYIMVGGPIKDFIKNLVLCPLYSLGHKKFYVLNSKPDPTKLAYVLELLNQGEIKPMIEEVYPLEQAIEAFKTFEKGHSKGKIVIHVADFEA